ncbi:hypothetical protein J6590_001637 [Homalodisca vitripennis]|nr:hypothetical protein J6590_001637 [Homalodisca vitripennis]
MSLPKAQILARIFKSSPPDNYPTISIYMAKCALTTNNFYLSFHFTEQVSFSCLANENQFRPHGEAARRGAGIFMSHPPSEFYSSL